MNLQFADSDKQGMAHALPHGICQFPIKSNEDKAKNILKKFGNTKIDKKISRIISQIDHPDDNLLKELSISIEQLEDSFADIMEIILHELKIDASQKIILEVNEDEISVASEDAALDRLKRVFEDTPELADLLKVLTKQTTLRQNLLNIGYLLNIDLDEGLRPQQEQSTRFRVAMKNGMTHFYFSPIASKAA